MFSCCCRRLEVVGERELALFPGRAAGSIYCGFQYESEDGAVAAPLRFLCSSLPSSAAPGSCNAGLEEEGMSAQPGWQQCVDYVNGGPGFCLLNGSPLAPLLHRQQHQLGAATTIASISGRVAKQQLEQQQLPQGLEGIELLATYPEHDGAAAALLCRVGSSGGRAVLCSSHPELHPSWLSGKAPPTPANGRGSGLCSTSCPDLAAQQPAAIPAAAGSGFVDTVSNRAAAASALAAELSAEGHVPRLQAALLLGQRQRWRFWRSLLAAAGLEPWLQPDETP
jgi:biotin--protein ligase